MSGCSGGQQFEPGVGCWVALMPPVHGWYSRNWELSGADRDETRLLVSSFALSCREYLKEMVFVLLQWLATGGFPLKRWGTGVFGGMRMIDGWWGTVPRQWKFPCLWHGAVECESLHSWSHRDMEEAFWERFWIFRGEILSVEIQISMKSPICDGDFLPRAIRWSIHTTMIGRSIHTTSEVREWRLDTQK